MTSLWFITVKRLSCRHFHFTRTHTHTQADKQTVRLPDNPFDFAFATTFLNVRIRFHFHFHFPSPTQRISSSIVCLNYRHVTKLPPSLPPLQPFRLSLLATQHLHMGETSLATVKFYDSAKHNSLTALHFHMLLPSGAESEWQRLLRRGRGRVEKCSQCCFCILHKVMSRKW